jgi:hypothetical protein
LTADLRGLTQKSWKANLTANAQRAIENFAFLCFFVSFVVEVLVFISASVKISDE